MLAGHFPEKSKSRGVEKWRRQPPSLGQRLDSLDYL